MVTQGHKEKKKMSAGEGNGRLARKMIHPKVGVMALESSSGEGCHTGVGTQGEEAVTLARPVTYRG